MIKFDIERLTRGQDIAANINNYVNCQRDDIWQYVGIFHGRYCYQSKAEKFVIEVYDGINIYLTMPGRCYPDYDAALGSDRYKLEIKDILETASLKNVWAKVHNDTIGKILKALD